VSNKTGRCVAPNSGKEKRNSSTKKSMIPNNPHQNWMP
jgi:hypothetical protein